jgi:hypothetical protein
VRGAGAEADHDRDHPDPQDGKYGRCDQHGMSWVSVIV